MSEVQGGGNVIVYSDVCLRYRVREMFLCTVMCFPEVQVEGNVTVYSDVCLRYRVREILLCTVMCACGTGWWKCYCVQ